METAGTREAVRDGNRQGEEEMNDASHADILYSTALWYCVNIISNTMK